MHRLLVTVTALVAALVLAGGAGAWTWPADGAVLRPFQLGADVYAGGQHRGIDVAGPEGSPVRAPATGTVTFAGAVPTHGRGVTIATGDGYSVTLVHLGSIAVAKGDPVAEGATVGVMGTSGEAEHAQPSVHLGIRRTSDAEGYVDPVGLLPARPTAPAPAPPPAPTPAPAPAPAPALPAAAAATPPPTAVPAPSPAPALAAPVAPPAVTAPVAPASVAPAPDTGVVVSQAPAEADAPFVVEHAARPERRAVDRVRPSVARLAHAPDPIAEPVAASSATASGDVSTRSTVDGRPTTPAHRRVETKMSRPVQAAPREHQRRNAAQALGPELDRPHASSGGPRERLRPAPQLAVASGDRAVGVPQLGNARDAEGGSTTSAVVATPDSGLDPTTMPLAVVLALGAAAMAAWMAARRIGGRGALLPHDADLLREREPAHRARVHDRGRGHLRPAPAAARP